jgi:hypothetical protein
MRTTDLPTLKAELTRLHRFEDDDCRPGSRSARGPTAYAAKILEWRAARLRYDADAMPEQARVLENLALQCAFLSAGLVNGHLTARYTGPNTPDTRHRLEHYTLQMRLETAEAFEVLFGEKAIVRRPVAWEAHS